ncbi:MAG: OsmC family protein [Chitinophagales bacterium]
MGSTEKIKSAIERITKTLTQKPSFGLGTGISKTTVVDGLTCEVREGKWKFTIDMPEPAGGNGTGPTPGVFGRAALGSCLAIGYMMRAALLGIPISTLEVEVQADYDDGPLFGTNPNIPAGYLEVRYLVSVKSEASEEVLLKLIHEADERSPYLDVFSRAQKCVRKINIISTHDS